MPCKAQHQEAGALLCALAGFTGNLAHQDARGRLTPGAPLDVGELVVSTFLSALVGRETATWPDVLEPAWHPRHRGPCHSWTAGTLLAVATVGALRSELPPLAKLLVGVGAVGYLAHLLDDAGTPFGLPLV